jgi:hypothetical protein
MLFVLLHLAAVALTVLARYVRQNLVLWAAVVLVWAMLIQADGAALWAWLGTAFSTPVNS